MVRNIGLALLSLVVTLAVCEGLLRVFGAGVLPRPDLYVDDADVGKRMRPGWTGDEFEAPVTINSKGLRNSWSCMLPGSISFTLPSIWSRSSGNGRWIERFC